MWEAQNPECKSSRTSFPFSGVTHFNRGLRKPALKSSPFLNSKFAARFFMTAASCGESGSLSSAKYARMPSIQVELRSKIPMGSSCMLLFSRTSQKTDRGVSQQADEANLDNASAWLLSDL